MVTWAKLSRQQPRLKVQQVLLQLAGQLLLTQLQDYICVLAAAAGKTDAAGGAQIAQPCVADEVGNLFTICRHEAG